MLWIYNKTYKDTSLLHLFPQCINLEIWIALESRYNNTSWEHFKLEFSWTSYQKSQQLSENQCQSPQSFYPKFHSTWVQILKITLNFIVWFWKISWYGDG